MAKVAETRAQRSARIRKSVARDMKAGPADRAKKPTTKPKKVGTHPSAVNKKNHPALRAAGMLPKKKKK